MSDVPPISQFNLCKRGIDLILGSGLWFLLSPLQVAIALGIKLTSPGPILYPWKVVGRGGRYFTGYKFRSMYENADAIKARLMEMNEMRGPVFKLTDDPRVTPLGRILRKYSLDELPQLWSVINGDMSLVGPRPPLQTEYVHFTEWQKQKLQVKPGLTCFWQVYGRNDIRDFNEWVQMDLDYIRQRSLAVDFKILMATIRSVLSGTGK
jgi:lipopolysaccharide/colanic/teichoic acid biosynthesis glycosyltransferase